MDQKNTEKKTVKTTLGGGATLVTNGENTVVSGHDQEGCGLLMQYYCDGLPLESFMRTYVNKP